MVPHLGLPVRGPIRRHALRNPSSPRAQGARFRPSRAGFGRFRARPGIQNPELRIANEPLSHEIALELVCKADLWCNRHCRMSPVVLERFWGLVWPKKIAKNHKKKLNKLTLSFGPNEPLSTPVSRQLVIRSAAHCLRRAAMAISVRSAQANPLLGP